MECGLLPQTRVRGGRGGARAGPWPGVMDPVSQSASIEHDLSHPSRAAACARTSNSFAVIASGFIRGASLRQDSSDAISRQEFLGGDIGCRRGVLAGHAVEVLMPAVARPGRFRLM